MPTHQLQLPETILEALSAALALAALYHLAALPLPAPQDYQEDTQDYQQTDQVDPLPALLPAYQLPELRTRPLVPAVNLSEFTYM